MWYCGNVVLYHITTLPLYHITTMSIIALVQKKGGVGKTSIACLLTLALRRAGHAVELRDYDAQGSASQAMALWKHPAVDAPSHIIYDSPPVLTAPGTLNAIDAAEIVLIPTSPNALDYWEADKTALFVLERNPKAKVRLVLNKLKPRTTLAKVFVSEGRPVPVLPFFLADRQAYQHAVVCGLDSLDKAAADELLNFTLNILSL